VLNDFGYIERPTLEFTLVRLLAHTTLHLLQSELVGKIEDWLVVTGVISTIIGVFAFS